MSLIRDLSPSAQPTEDPAAMRAEIDRLTAALGADANAREQHERLLQVIVDSTSGWFDPAQIQQVLINLVKNAHEAGGPRDGVGIEVDAAPEGGVRFTVLDRGPGMSDDVMSRALVPAFTTKERGSGMGLTLCREIVEAHDGRLRIGRREGSGMQISFWLPSRTPEASVSRARLTLTGGR